MFVQFISWYENPDFIFVAMEYIELGDLSQYLKSPTPPLDAKEIARQVLSGLVILHERKVCHRDIKPQVWPPSVFPKVCGHGRIEFSIAVSWALI